MPQPLMTPIQLGTDVDTRTRRAIQQMWTDLIDYIDAQIVFKNTVINVTGGGLLPVTYITGAYSVGDTDSAFVAGGVASGITITLPYQPTEGRNFYFYNRNPNAVEIDAQGGEQLYQEGTGTKVTTYVLDANAKLHIVYYDGDWHPI